MRWSSFLHDTVIGDRPDLSRSVLRGRRDEECRRSNSVACHLNTITAHPGTSRRRCPTRLHPGLSARASAFESVNRRAGGLRIREERRLLHVFRRRRPRKPRSRKKKPSQVARADRPRFLRPMPSYLLRAGRQDQRLRAPFEAPPSPDAEGAFRTDDQSTGRRYFIPKPAALLSERVHLRPRIPVGDKTSSPVVSYRCPPASSSFQEQCGRRFARSWPYRPVPNPGTCSSTQPSNHPSSTMRAPPRA